MDEFPRENRSLTSFNFDESTQRTNLGVWKTNVENMPEEERSALKIYKADDKTKTEYFVTTNDRGELVASDGKSKLLLYGAKWQVPDSTLEILKKPNKPSPTGLGKK